MFKESNKEVEERFLLTKERIEEIAAGEKNGMNEKIQNYFKKTAQLLKKCAEDFVCISSDAWKSRSFEQLKSENALFYQDILPQNYGHSFANPAFAVQELGEEFGRILSFLYTELRSERAFVFEQNLEKITILNELFLEIYCMFEEGDVTYKQIKDTIYWFLYDYADDWAGYRVRELVDPALDFATSIIMDSDLLDLTYLYSYGDYISEVEIETMESQKAVEKTKDELITNVAHDLRTPLTSILGYLDLLTQGDFLTEEQKQKYLGIVSSKAKQLETLVKDLFDYTRYDKNKVKIKKEILDLNLFVPQLVDEFYPSFMDHKLECRTDFYEGALNIEGNGELLARAIGNLISNAIKYGVDGKLVEVHTGLKDKMAFVAIVNYGKIIPAEDLDKIFDKFYRVENSRSLKTGGTGLGLAIAKNIVNLHEGEIWATSDESGTRFQIELPVVQAHVPKAGK